MYQDAILLNRDDLGRIDTIVAIPGQNPIALIKRKRRHADRTAPEACPADTRVGLALAVLVFHVKRFTLDAGGHRRRIDTLLVILAADKKRLAFFDQERHQARLLKYALI